MGLRTPSKYVSLKYLTMLIRNDYCNKDTGVDYVPSEVDKLYYWKLGKLSEVEDKKWVKKENLQHLTFLKSLGRKYCSLCNTEKNVSEFHVDNSKKFIAYRSHCKLCRSLKYQRQPYKKKKDKK